MLYFFCRFWSSFYPNRGVKVIQVSKTSITRHPFTLQQSRPRPSMLKHLQSACLMSTREMSWDEHLCIVLQGKGRGKNQASISYVKPYISISPILSFKLIKCWLCVANTDKYYLKVQVTYNNVNYLKVQSTYICKSTICIHQIKRTGRRTEGRSAQWNVF